MQMNKFGLRKTQNCSSQSNNKIDSDILFFLNLLFLMLFKLHSSKIQIIDDNNDIKQKQKLFF